MSKNGKPYKVSRVRTYKGLVTFLKKRETEKTEKIRYWIYRGEYSSGDLETTLENYCRKYYRRKYDYPLPEAPGIEDEMIRQFRRLYRGDDRQDVEQDTLYCISLMRHYGAPSRLLDFTYSKEVATYFALQYAFDNVPPKKEAGKEHERDYGAKRRFTLWCIDADDLESKARGKYLRVASLINKRYEDTTRTDDSFIPLYMENKYNIVISENPLRIHERPGVQQGVFLCPGNVGISFMDNLSALYKGENKDGIIKVTFEIEPKDLIDRLEEYRGKTITRQSLFPGLQGFAESLKYQFPLYKHIHERRMGIWKK